jgi:hypothetical protein
MLGPLGRGMKKNKKIVGFAHDSDLSKAYSMSFHERRSLRRPNSDFRHTDLILGFYESLMPYEPCLA